MARVFDRRESQYLESPGTAGIAGPPFWLAMWFRVDQRGADQALFFLGSGNTLYSYYAVVVKGDGAIAAVSVGPTDGRGEARSPGPPEPGLWCPVVACWASTHRRSIHFPFGQATHEGRVAVPYVDRMAIGRLSTSLPTSYLSGALAWVSVGIGIPTPQQIAALLGGVDPRLIFRLGQLRVFLPLAGSDRDLLGRSAFVAGGMPGWDKSPVLIAPCAAWTMPASASVGPPPVWARTETGRVFVPQPVAGLVSLPGVQNGMVWG